MSTGPRAPLPPSARILLPTDRVGGGHVAMLPAVGGQPSVIFVSLNLMPKPTKGSVVWPFVVALAGDLARGDHPLFGGAWDGVSGVANLFWSNTVTVAGDVDRDGHLDMWFGHELLLGPFLGRAQTWGLDRVAYIEGYPDPTGPGTKEYAIAGDFDADADGEIDVITQMPSSTRGFIRYGPFSGPFPSAGWGLADPATYTSLGEDYGCDPGMDNYRGTWLRDHLGPGRDGIAVGSDPSGFCGGSPGDTWLWDPFLPRGTHLRYDQAFAVTSYGGDSMIDAGVYDAGDVDLDGHPDLILTDDQRGLIYPGPIEGLVYWAMQPYQPVVNGTVARAVGDVNGDGARDLVGVWPYGDGADAPTAYGSRVYGTWVLICSPYASPIDVSKGVVLGDYDAHAWNVGQQSADLDGDGLADLVDTDLLVENAVRIWYGRDLKLACEQHGQG